MTALLDAKIIDTEVEAEYQGNVYEQTVVIKPDETEIEVFEGRNFVTDSDRGSTVSLVLRAHLIQDIEVVTDQPLGFSQDPERESKWSATIVGRIITMDVDDGSTNPGTSTLIVDIGSGEIYLQISDQTLADKELEHDNLIRSCCGRIDIINRL